MKIQAFHLTKVHSSGVQVLEDAYFSAPSGSFTVVIGESKTGKSTFLKMLAGEERLTSGTLRMDHLDLYALSQPEKQRWLSEVGMIFPDLQLFPDKTIEENILLILHVKGVDADMASQKQAINKLLFNAGLGAKAKVKPQDLSSGEQRMVMAVRAMIFKPRLLLADDPFQGFDDKASSTLFKLFLELNKTGATVVLSTQQASFREKAGKVAPGFSPQWIRLANGKLLPDEEKTP
jgi:cell division transport system ATP-binding protein